jgi:hypothetical protein
MTKECKFAGFVKIISKPPESLESGYKFILDLALLRGYKFCDQHDKIVQNLDNLVIQIVKADICITLIPEKKLIGLLIEEKQDLEKSEVNLREFMFVDFGYMIDKVLYDES